MTCIDWNFYRAKINTGRHISFLIFLTSFLQEPPGKLAEALKYN